MTIDTNLDSTPTATPGFTRGPPPDDFGVFDPELRTAIWDTFRPERMHHVMHSLIEEGIERRVKREVRYLQTSWPTGKPTPTQINSKKEQILRRVKESTNLITLLLAHHPTLFEKYCPEMAPYVEYWIAGSDDLREEAKLVFSFLNHEGSPLANAMTIGEVLEIFMKQSTSHAKLVRDQAQDEAKALFMIADLWRGTNAAVIDGFVKLCKEYGAKYTNYSGRPNIISFTPHLASRFSDIGKIDVDQWYSQSKFNKLPITEYNYDEFALEFKTQVWTKMHPLAQIRAEVECSVTENQKLSFLTKVQAMGCTAEDFWPVRTTTETRATVHAIQTQEPVKVNKWLTRPEDALKAIARILQERPKACWNCFEDHPVKDCPRIHSDSRQNPGAWLMTNYAELSGHHSKNFQQKCALEFANLKKLNK